MAKEAGNDAEPLTILIVGGGGREHALAEACRRSPNSGEILVAPGNGGIEREFECPSVPAENVDAQVALARERGAGLVIIGPEGPLSLGLADRLRAEGIAVYGPGADGARLEADKAYAKAFMAKHNVPTAQGATFSDPRAALAEIANRPSPMVIKASGLAAGKGVVIAQTPKEAEEAALGMLSGEWFGASGAEIVIEDFLEGEEASITLVVSEGNWAMLPVSQDHKRIGEEDTGPNTGGMGAYAPAAILKGAVLETVTREVIEPSIRGLVADAIDFRGTLYIGVMLTPQGPRVLEYNVRFGDPETQVILPLLRSDPVDLFWSAATGTLDPGRAVDIRENEYAAVVVLSAEGYPGSSRNGDVITLPESIDPAVQIYHAGVQRADSGHLVTAGGRVLGVSATGGTLPQALTRAYETCGRIDWQGRYYRNDIGWRELARLGV